MLHKLSSILVTWPTLLIELAAGISRFVSYLFAAPFKA